MAPDCSKISSFHKIRKKVDLFYFFLNSWNWKKIWKTFLVQIFPDFRIFKNLNLRNFIQNTDSMCECKVHFLKNNTKILYGTKICTIHPKRTPIKRLNQGNFWTIKDFCIILLKNDL